jgi:hypothetical protein
MPRPPEIEQSEVLSIRVPASVVRTIDAHAEGSSRSAAAAVFLQFGIEELTRPGAREALEAHHLLMQLEAVANRWPAGRTPAGSAWMSAPDQLPAVLEAGQVVVTPAGVIARLWGGTFVVDVEAGVLQLVSDQGRSWQVAIDRRGLAQLVPAWASAMIPLATSDPGDRFQLPLGLVLERLPDGGLVLAGGELQVGLGAGEAFQLSAELASLLATRLRTEGERVQALNGALAATPEVQEVTR